MRGALAVACLLMGRAAADGAWPAPIADAPKKGFWQTVGNVRFALSVSATGPAPQSSITAADAVTVTVPWRRIDADVLSKDRYIVSASGDVVAQCAMEAGASADSATFTFVPESGAGTYYLYYMPFYTCEYQGGSCPWGQGAVQTYYNPPAHCNATVARAAAPRFTASVAGQETKTDFDAYEPMQVPMSAGEAAGVLARAPQGTTGAVLVGEDRARQVKMTKAMPLIWSSYDLTGSFSGSARPGENYTYQIAVAATGRPVQVTSVAFAPSPVLRDARCMNLQGSDFWGRDVSYGPVQVPAGEVGVLWLAMEVPADAAAGVYRTPVAVALADNAGNTETRNVTLTLNVAGAPVLHGGDDNVTAGTRLQWLDSKMGLEASKVPFPYTPITVADKAPSQLVVTLLAKQVVIGANGLPQSIATNTSSPTGTVTTQVLAEPVDFTLRDYAVSSAWALKVTTNQAAKVAWEATATLAPMASQTNANAVVKVTGSIDCTGYMAYNVSVVNSAPSDWAAVLRVPANPTFKFAMPFGVEGGYKADVVPEGQPQTWMWDGKNGNNAAWVGGTRGGIRTALKGDDPLWQAAVPYDSLTLKTPETPQSWSNGGAGGARLFNNGTFEGFTGTHKGTVAEHFVFTMVVTPVRPLDLKRQYANRYAQIGYPLSNDANYTFLAEHGATVVNMHQGTEINPWINYPYLTNDKMKATADTCHSLGMKYSIYNTMRELSNRCEEKWAMLAFNETFVVGANGGADWLEEHIQPAYNYEPAWSTPLSGFRQDAAMKVNALSRWNNYYVAGMKQMKTDFGFDGFYLDEIAYDRLTLFRARNVIGDAGVVDHHSDRGGFTMSPSLNYMELYPFIDRLWYGEGFDYDHATPGYWLVEMSGLPYGMTSDMLRYPGTTPYHFHGLLFGSTNRWQSGLTPDLINDPYTPIGLWKLWKSFDIDASAMYGWWMADEDGVGSVPVTSSAPLVKVTSYVKHGQGALIAVANFAQDDANVTLSIDFGMLGLDSAKVTLSAPLVEPFQPQAHDRLPFDNVFAVKARKGWVLLLQ